MSDADMEKEEVLSDDMEKQLDARLLTFLVRSYQPITMVEGQGFIGLIRALNNNYVMPTRKTITKKILPEMFSKSLEEQTLIVQQNADTICLTVDRWTSVKYQDPLIAITAHFITPDYTFKSVLLKCCYCERNSEDLKLVLTETCVEWEISDKINSCVTDDGPDIVQAVKSLGWIQRSCMAYKLNLAVQNSLKLCDETVSKLKIIVRYFESNLEADQMLDEFQIEQGIAEPMELLDSEQTSWTTKYDMIERFLTLREAIEEVDLPDITNQDWVKLKQLCKLLKPFKEATEELGGDKYGYASIVIAIVNGLKDVLQELGKQPDYDCTIKEVAKCIENELGEQFNGIENDPDLALCTILDPRYKLSMFLDENAANKAKSNLVSEVEEQIKHGKSPTVLSKIADGSSIAYNGDEINFSLWRKRTMIMEKKKSFQSAHTQQEVESYLQEDLADSDPCQWWQSNKSKYPHLAKLFTTRCNKVATSIPSERLFTKQGIALCESRKNLSLRKAKMIVFLCANLNDDDYIRLMPEMMLI